MKIRFCEHNKGKGKVYRRLQEEFPTLNVKIKSCIKQCGACRELPMATVDGKKITGHDGDALYKKLIKILSENRKED